MEKIPHCAAAKSISNGLAATTRHEDSSVLRAASTVSAQSLLCVEGLTVRYRDPDGEQILAVDGVTLELAAGEAVGVLGESGCGKTTLGLTLLGLLPPAASTIRGSVVFRGKNLLTLKEPEFRELRGAAISMVYQESGSALNPVLRVGQQLAEVVRAHQPLARERAREEASSLLAQVGFPKDTFIAAAYPHQLSGGQQQRVAIAQAIAARPALLIADEPTTALDRVTQIGILDLLTSIRTRLQLALLLISHDPDVHARTVERVVVMRNGRIIDQGRTRDVLNTENAYTQTLLKSWRVPERYPHNFSSPGSVSTEPSPQHTDCLTSEPATLLSAVHLRKSYLQGRWPSPKRHQVQALRGVDLTLHTGSTLALIGVSGSGKSTLARCLACLERPDSGEIWFERTNLTLRSHRKLIPFRRQIQMIFQDPGSSLNPHFTALQIISEPLVTVAWGRKKQWRERALELMELVGLQADWEKRLPHQFSAGQRRRLAIARALALEPRVLILDEALTGLDVPIQTQIAGLLRELQARLSLAYLYISHDLRLMSQIADQVMVLHQGQIVEADTPVKLFAKPQSVPASNLVRASLELCGSGD
jgi:peptide/nickel transport system ATP-binding protein